MASTQIISFVNLGKAALLKQEDQNDLGQKKLSSDWNVKVTMRDSLCPDFFLKTLLTASILYELLMHKMSACRQSALLLLHLVVQWALFSNQGYGEPSPNHKTDDV